MENGPVLPLSALVSHHPPFIIYVIFTVSLWFVLSIGNVCPLLVAPDNGQVFVRGVTVGSTARYSCQQGFVLRGAADRTCLSQGTWSGREPVCQAVNCPDLPDPANGEVTLSGITFDSTATYRSTSTSSQSFSRH